MKIVTVLGSPRRRGNTARALGWVEEQFRADRHDVDHIEILDYKVCGCRECLVCKKGGTEKLCAVEDDAVGLFERMAKSDLVLLAAPVFCWGYPAQIKALIDRTYCLMDFEGPRTDLPRLNGKGMALLLTAGGDRIDNADLVFRGFHHMVGLLRARLAGTWLVPNCTEPDALGEDVRRHAADFARTLAGKIAS
ncbi:MAG: flavodoxin family protein [Thermoguttaceae bacterium]|jgi:multimeric flavodoxin WrbA